MNQKRWRIMHKLVLDVFTKSQVEELLVLDVVTKAQAEELFGGREGSDFATRLAKLGLGKRRIDVSYSNMYRALAENGNVWKKIKKMEVEKPKCPDGIVKKMAYSVATQESLWLFSPWGPRYKKKTPVIKNNDPEIYTLKQLKRVFDIFKEGVSSVNLLVMPADVYGTDINGLPEQFVREYFAYLEDAARECFDGAGLIVKPWSMIREENGNRYSELKSWVDEDFDWWIAGNEYRTALKTARVFNPRDPEKSAQQYCKERFIEADIVGQQYDPIKISLVRKEKDGLDTGNELRSSKKGPIYTLNKTLYVIPEKNRAPWMRGDK